jgi:hypothetical protein
MRTLPGIAARLRKALRSVSGAFDLPSIIVGVVVVGILAAGVLAAVFGVIPFAQDNAAKQDLDSVRTAEGVAKTRLDGFKDKDGLLTGGLISDRRSFGVGADAKGSCYVGISKSATGNIYFNSDKATEPALLTAGLDTGCIDGAARDGIVASIGGYPTGPSAAGATPTSGSTTGALVDTSGSTTGLSTGGGSTVLAGDRWSGQRTITNSYPDPGFKNGISGWTGDNIYRDYVDNAATTVAYAAGSGYKGDAGALLISATGSTNRDRTTAYFPIDVPNVKDFSFQITTPDGTWDPYAAWYGDLLFTDMSGNVIGSSGSPNATRAGGLGANVWERFDYVNYYSTPSEPHRTYLMIQADHVPAGKTISMLVDRIYVASDACGWDCAAPDSPSVAGYEPNFDGSYPTSADWTYSWTGAVNASPSKAVSPRNIAAPASANVGDTIEIKGTGYDPDSTVTPAVFFGGTAGYDAHDFNGAPVRTDGSGNFTTTMLIPASTQPWNWGISIAEDTSWTRSVRIDINSVPGTGPSTATPPGPWSVPEPETTEQISASTDVTLGTDFVVMGKGYAPFTRVDLYDASWDVDVTAYTDNTGYFTATMNIPTDADAPGPGIIRAYGDGEAILDVTYH